MNETIDKMFQNMVENWGNVDSEISRAQWMLIEKIYPRSIEIFQNLTDDKKLYILETQKEFCAPTFSAYMFLWNKIGQPEFEPMFITTWGYTKLRKKIVSNYPVDRTDPYIYNAAIPNRIVTKFEKLCGLYTVGESVLLYTMRVLYGDELIEEYMDRQSVEAPDSTIFDMVRVLEDWGNVKKFPLTWCIQIINSE